MRESAGKTLRLRGVVITISLVVAMLCSHDIRRAIGAMTLQGSGSSFDAPLFQRWFADYNKQHPDIQINYQSVGSGAGIKQFQQGLTNFGASDAAMTDAQMATVKGGVVLLPVTAGAVVYAYNLSDVSGELKLSRKAECGIFMGRITSWKDPEIAKTNPGVSLPDQKITVVHRSDGSGTTFVVTTHLSAVCPEWKAGPGKGTSVDFPVGVGGKGNEGVTALVKQTPGAIGYVEYGYALLTKAPMVSLENKAGKFVKPDLQTAKNALAHFELDSNLRGWDGDPSGEDSYSIASYSWIMLHKKYPQPETAQALKGVVEYGLGPGQSVAPALGYVPLPDSIIAKVKKALAQVS